MFPMNNVLKIAFWLTIFSALACGDSSRPPEGHEEGEAQQVHHEAERLRLTPAQIARMGIEVSEVKTRSLAPLLEFPGSVAFDENYVSYVSAAVEGKISRVIADYGTKVSKNAVLAWIESPSLGQAQAEFLAAQAAWKAEAPAYERAKTLSVAQAISLRELQEREARWHSVEGEYLKTHANLQLLGMSKENISRLEETREVSARFPLRSPIAGEVIERAAAPGQAVSPSERLFTVADLSQVWVFVDLYEKDVAKIRRGQKVSIMTPAYPHETFEGVLDFVGQSLQEETRTAKSRAVAVNRERKLKPGMFVTVTVSLESGENVNAVAVPPSALIRVGDEEVAFVETAEGEFEPRHLETGRRYGNYVEVLKGIAEGDRVAIKGVFTLKSKWLEGELEEHED